MDAQDNKSYAARLQVYNFGCFVVQRGPVIINDSTRRSYKLWNLLAYLLAYREKRHPSQALYELLWSEDNDVTSPEHALRTLIYRLRQVLNQGPSGNETVPHIIYTQGAYSWNPAVDFWMDAVEFEEKCARAGGLMNTDPAGAALAFREALFLYKGEYLPELSHCEWTTALRHSYRRLYVDSILQCNSLFKKERLYSDIRRNCENALQLEPLEEEIHQQYIEVLLEEGKTRQALEHYEETTAYLYRELGVIPSPALRNLYRRIKAAGEGIEMDLALVLQGLKERQPDGGAFKCDPEMFRLLYKLEERRVARTGQSVYLILLTLTRPDYSVAGKAALDEVMPVLENTVLSSLRRGDVITRWNEAQLLLLLPGLNFEQAELVLGRIKNRFTALPVRPPVTLRGKLHPLVESAGLNNIKCGIRHP